jgi:hypothetical protein
MDLWALPTDFRSLGCPRSRATLGANIRRGNDFEFEHKTPVFMTPMGLERHRDPCSHSVVVLFENRITSANAEDDQAPSNIPSFIIGSNLESREPPFAARIAATVSKILPHW